MKAYLCAFAGLITTVQAWFCTGHMLVAQIAMIDLLDSSPETYLAVEKVLSALDGSLTHGISNNMVEAACWADDLKRHGLTAFNEWHYLNMPVNPDGIINAITKTCPDALWAISQAMSTLSNKGKGDASLEQAIQLRLLIHIIGDIHQPLHVATMVSKNYTSGDDGGTYFYIDFDSKINELHALWDAGLGYIEEDFPRPFTDSSSKQFYCFASQFMNNYTRYDLAEELSESDPEIWTLDIFHLAVTEVYSNIKENERPSAEYLENGWRIVSKQIALGGYRLADLLKQLYETPSN